MHLRSYVQHFLTNLAIRISIKPEIGSKIVSAERELSAESCEPYVPNFTSALQHTLVSEILKLI